MRNLRSIVLVLLAATAVPMWAAQLRVKGEVTELNSRKPLSGVLIRIYKNGEKQHIMDSGTSGRYSVLLDNNASYVVRFSKPGLITKCFSIDTYGPVWEDDRKVHELEVEMTMFEAVPGLDLTFFDLPLGLARFVPATGMVHWSMRYEKNVMPEVQRLMTEIGLRRDQLAVTTERRTMF